MTLGKSLRWLVPLFLVCLTRLGVQAMQPKYEPTSAQDLRTPHQLRVPIVPKVTETHKDEDDTGSSASDSSDEDGGALEASPGCCSSPPIWLVKAHCCKLKGAQSFERVRNIHGQPVTRVRFEEGHAYDYFWHYCYGRCCIGTVKRRKVFFDTEGREMSTRDGDEAIWCILIAIGVVCVVVFLLYSLIAHGSDYASCAANNLNCKGRHCLKKLCGHLKRGYTTAAATTATSTTWNPWIHTLAITTTTLAPQVSQEEIDRVMHYLRHHPSVRKLQETAGSSLGRALRGAGRAITDYWMTAKDSGLIYK